jgi:hypothetical protein
MGIRMGAVRVDNEVKLRESREREERSGAVGRTRELVSGGVFSRY